MDFLLLVGASGSVPYWIRHVPDSLRVHQLQEELEFGKTQLRCGFGKRSSLGKFWRTTLPFLKTNIESTENQWWEDVFPTEIVPF